MHTLARVIVLALAVSLLAACPSRQAEHDATGERLPARPRADLSTPEAALKSYWSMLDWLRLRQRIEDIRDESAEGRVKTGEVMASVSGGDALASFAEAPRRDLRLERTIVSVNRTDDTHAEAIARIRTISADVTAFTPTPIELFESAPGGEFRYQLERDSNGWKVTEVWRLDLPEGPRRLR